MCQHTSTHVDVRVRSVVLVYTIMIPDNSTNDTTCTSTCLILPSIIPTLCFVDSMIFRLSIQVSTMMSPLLSSD